MLERFSTVNAVRIPFGEASDSCIPRMLAYWEEKRGDRPCPRRSDLDPLDFSFALGRVCILRHEPAAATFRYVLDGTDVVHFNGQDLTGRTIDEARPAFYPDLLRAHFTEVIETGQPTLYRIEVRTLDRISRYQRLALPLAHVGPQPDTVLTLSADLREAEAMHQLVAKDPPA